MFRAGFDPGGLPAEPRTAEEMRAAGGRADAAANAAFLARDYEAALDLIDDARAYGALLAGEWSRLHAFIADRAAGEGRPAVQPETQQAERPPTIRVAPRITRVPTADRAGQ